jgi:hypothetical protein
LEQLRKNQHWYRVFTAVPAPALPCTTYPLSEFISPAPPGPAYVGLMLVRPLAFAFALLADGPTANPVPLNYKMSAKSRNVSEDRFLVESGFIFRLIYTF